MIYIFFSVSLSDIWVAPSFWLLLNNVTVNTVVQKFLSGPASNFGVNIYMFVTEFTAIAIVFNSVLTYGRI